MKLGSDLEVWDKYHEFRKGGDMKLAKLERRAENAKLELYYLGRLFWQQKAILVKRIDDANKKFVERMKELGFEIEPGCEVAFYPEQLPAVIESVPNIDAKYFDLIKKLQYIVDNEPNTPIGQKIRDILEDEKNG